MVHVYLIASGVCTGGGMPVVVCGPALWFLSEPNLFMWFLCLRKPNVPTDLRMGLWRHLLFSVLIQDFTETRSSASRFCIILLQSSGSSCSYFFLNSGSSYRICGTQCHLDLQNGDRCESGIIGLKLKHFNHLSIDISQGTMLIICRHLLVFKDCRHRGTAIRQR